MSIEFEFEGVTGESNQRCPYAEIKVKLASKRCRGCKHFRGIYRENYKWYLSCTGTSLRNNGDNQGALDEAIRREKENSETFSAFDEGLQLDD